MVAGYQPAAPAAYRTGRVLGGVEVAKAPLEVVTWPVAERRRVTREEAGLTDLLGRLPNRTPTLSDRRFGKAGGGGARRCQSASGGDQPTSGSRVRQGARPTGQNRPAGC